MVKLHCQKIIHNTFKKFNTADTQRINPPDATVQKLTLSLQLGLFKLGSELSLVSLYSI